MNNSVNSKFGFSWHQPYFSKPFFTINSHVIKAISFADNPLYFYYIVPFQVVYMINGLWCTFLILCFPFSHTNYFQKLNSRDITAISLYILVFETQFSWNHGYFLYVLCFPFHVHDSILMTSQFCIVNTIFSNSILFLYLFLGPRLFPFVLCPLSVCPTFLSLTLLVNNNSRVFLLCQIWIVNYYVKSSSNTLSNENKHSLFPEKWYYKIVHLGILIHILSWRQQKHQCLFSLLRLFDELFDVIIDDPYLA